MKKIDLYVALGATAGACALFYGILGTPAQVRQKITEKGTVSSLSMSDTAEKLIQITKDSFAPVTKEQYKDSYNKNKELFTGAKADELYGIGKDVITGVETKDEDVLYTSTHGADESTSSMYRVSMTLIGRTGQTPIDVYYYISGGKIFDVVVMKGGE